MASKSMTWPEFKAAVAALDAPDDSVVFVESSYGDYDVSAIWFAGQGVHYGDENDTEGHPGPIVEIDLAYDGRRWSSYPHAREPEIPLWLERDHAAERALDEAGVEHPALYRRTSRVPDDSAPVRPPTEGAP